MHPEIRTFRYTYEIRTETIAFQVLPFTRFVLSFTLGTFSHTVVKLYFEICEYMFVVLFICSFVLHRVHKAVGVNCL